MVIAGCVIWFLSPQEAENKPLSLQEKYVYRKQTTKYLIILMVIAWIGSVFYEIPQRISSAWIIPPLLLILGYFTTRTVLTSFTQQSPLLPRFPGNPPAGNYFTYG